MKIKICGLKNSEELARIDSACRPDYIGLIFHEESSRNFECNLEKTKTQAKKVGVFVNKSEEFIITQIEKHRLNLVQLHGEESPELCYRLDAIVNVIKVFSISNEFSFSQTLPYRKACKYFLFDTAVDGLKGGTGQKFDWQKLKEYQGMNNFFLSGGIGPSDLEEIKNVSHPKLVALDLNSKFEVAPGIKNIELLNNFIQNVSKN